MEDISRLNLSKLIALQRGNLSPTKDFPKQESEDEQDEVITEEEQRSYKKLLEDHISESSLA